MSKSRPFSIYLLKLGYNASNSLILGHSLKPEKGASSLPAGASLFLLDEDPHEPWWKEYFGIKKALFQSAKGALLFLPVNDRCFAISFGHAFHNLKDSSYEYDFGLRVTLNSLDPKKLKSTDVLEPGSARRQRTQVPIESDLTYFDFDRDSSVLKSLTGKVKDQYMAYFKHATGASNLHISSMVSSDGLVELCKTLQKLYAEEAYKKTFPDIQNIVPVRDQLIIQKLSEKLLRAFRTKDDNLYLTIPDIIEYRNNFRAAFSGAGSSYVYDDVYMDRYYEYLEQNKKTLNSVGIEELKHHLLHLTNEEGTPQDSYCIFKCMLYDTSLNGGKGTFHLCEGNWYKVEADYIAELTAFLDPFYSDLPLLAYNHQSEGAYNKDIAAQNSKFLCLDRTNISPHGQTPIEPCDLYVVADRRPTFYHIKRFTSSAELSHLFNQGANPIELLKSDGQAVKKLKKLIEKIAPSNVLQRFVKPLEKGEWHVIYGIITNKDKTKKSFNLPLFSRISLRRSLKTLQIMSVKANYGFILDQRPRPLGQKRKRKKVP